MAREHVRIYLKGGAVIEFVADGFRVDRGGENLPGEQIGRLDMGTVEDLDLAFIDLAQVAAITKTPERSRAPQPRSGASAE